MKVEGYSLSEGNDVLDLDRLRRTSKGTDIVFHLAAFADPAQSLRNPAAVMDINVRGTVNVLESCRLNDFFLVYPSSCEVYGDSTTPIHENFPLNPPNPYAASKAAGDRLCFTYAKAYGIRVAILRLFNPYGPHQQLNKIIARFHSQAVKGEPITVYGNGEDTRDYTYVDDIVRGLILARKAPHGEAVNICTGRALTSMEVALMVKQVTNSDSPVMSVVYPALFGGIKNQIGSNSKAHQSLGWKPTIRFEDGLRKTVDWLENAHSERRAMDTRKNPNHAALDLHS